MCIEGHYIYMEKHEFQLIAMVSINAGVGNLSRVAGQKPTPEALAGRTNFPPTIPFSLPYKMSVKLGNLLNFNEIHSQFSQFVTKAQNTTYNTMGAGRGGGGFPSPWILKISAKKVVFLVSSGKKISPLLASPWKNFGKFPWWHLPGKKSFRCPRSVHL